MLQYDVFIAPPKPIFTKDLPPGEARRMFSPVSSTLIYGERDALLVDPLMTVVEVRALADWIASKGKDLRTIYVTHGHGDHSFGISVLQQQFPKALAVATRGVIEHMKKQLAPPFFDKFWKAYFPGQLPEQIVLPEQLEGDTLELEGEQLVVVDLGHTDTDATTALHVPSIGLVVAGDAIYNDVHQYLSESDAAGRRQWLAAIDKIASLKPRAIVAGHKRDGNADDPRIVEETRQYIVDFDRAVAETATAEQLYERIQSLYPNRVNPGALWSSSRAHKGGAR